jgi:hypothetical protein
MKRLVICVVVVIMTVSGSAAAAEESGAPPYFLVVDGEIEKAAIGPWSEAVVSLIEAHDAHPDGTMWATFRELTGGPDVRVGFFHGFSKMADLDDWTPTRRILVDVLGPVEGSAVKDALARGLDSSDRVMTLVDDLSRPWTGTKPPKYLWVATVRVADGKITEYAALAKRVRRAFDSHADTVHWLCYANAIGGESSELTFYYGFNAFAEVDSWPSRREVLAIAHGERNGVRLASALESITETTTSLWRFEPELSRLAEER